MKKMIKNINDYNWKYAIMRLLAKGGEENEFCLCVTNISKELLSIL